MNKAQQELKARAKPIIALIRDKDEINSVELARQYADSMTPQAFGLALDAAIKALWTEGICFRVTGAGDSKYIRHTGEIGARHMLSQARQRVTAARAKCETSARQAAAAVIMTPEEQSTNGTEKAEYGRRQDC